MNILACNPGGNSLKVELVRCQPEQQYAYESESLFSVIIEGIGKEPQLSTRLGERPISEQVAAESYAQAAQSLVEWWEDQAIQGQLPKRSEVDAIALRVVHGAREFSKPVPIDQHVLARIVEFEKLAPLHNKSSVEVFESLQRSFPHLPAYAVFDTAFHRTIPTHASAYGIPQALAEKHQIRRYGFHGVSHRYLLELCAPGRKAAQAVQHCLHASGEWVFCQCNRAWQIHR